MAWRQGGGKGSGGTGGTWQPAFQKEWDGKGRGKGKSNGKNGFINASKTVWVGNLPDGCSFADLLAHAKQAGNAKWADVFPKKGAGSGAVGFSSEQEAAYAVQVLNGSVLGHSTIECDSWAKTEGGGKSSRGGKGGSWQPAFKKEWDGGGKGKGKSKGGKNGRIISSKTVWVGGLPDGCSFIDLLTHAKQAGNAKWADVFPKKGAGTGAVGFSSEQEAANAIIVLNGSALGSSTIVCDAWEKPQK